jgi:hypothetical protein
MGHFPHALGIEFQFQCVNTNMKVKITRHPIGFGLSCCLRNFMLWFCSMGNAIHGLGFTTLDKIKNIIILLFEINKFIMSIIALLTILLLL